MDAHHGAAALLDHEAPGRDTARVVGGVDAARHQVVIGWHRHQELPARGGGRLEPKLRRLSQRKHTKGVVNGKQMHGVEH